MSINFGLGYKGSKSAIAADLIRLIPSGERFVDVFAGGCAMTHAALLAGRWKSILANDIVPLPEFFVNAVKGKYKRENRWISREDFFRLKDTDLFARYCFSFGNNGDEYMYNTKIEPYKKACHYAIFFDQWDDMYRLCPEVVATAQAALKGKTDTKARRLAFGPAIVRKLRTLDPRVIKANPLYSSCHKNVIARKPGSGAKYSASPESLESLESLQSLERLERLERLQARQGDYREIEVRPGDVLYCDPPYKGTDGYNEAGFDHEAFYNWVAAQDVPVYISEFWMPEDRFMCIWEKKRASRLSQKGTEGKVSEKLFVPRRRKS